jgi:aspartate aminotransferase-like enzyme
VFDSVMDSASSLTSKLKASSRHKTVNMLPGPARVPKSVMRSMLHSEIYHRSDEFHEIFEEIQVNLRYLFGTKRDVYVLTSSGTGGLEAVVSNLLKPGEKVVTIVNGYFSQQLCEIVEAFKCRPIRLEQDWKNGISLEAVEQLLTRENDIKAVAVAYVETSTGCRAPLRDLADLCAKYDALLVVDAESAIGGESFSFDEWNIGACVAGTQKCISSPPGLSLVGIGEKAWEALERTERTGFYFDLKRYDEYNKRKETPFTPALPLFFALREALRLIKREGLEAWIARHQRCASLLRDGLAEIGLQPFVPLEYCSNVATAVEITSTKISASRIVSQLSASYGVAIAAGMGDLKEKIIRIGTMGTVTSRDVNLTLNALEKVICR